MATSVAESLPDAFCDRTKFPQSALLPAILAFFGFLISLLCLYSKSKGIYNWHFFTSQRLIYLLIFSLLVEAVVPLSISKVVNSGREDLFAFVQKQGGRALASFRKNWTIVSLVMSGILVLFIYAYLFPEVNHEYFLVFRWFSMNHGRWFSSPKGREKIISAVWLAIGTFIVF